MREPLTKAGLRLRDLHAIALASRPNAGGLTWVECVAAAGEAVCAIEDEAIDSTELRSAESDIPAGQPCPICGPEGHGRHEDDSYGNCVVCMAYVPHSDMAYERVPFPCAPAILAAQHD